MVYFITMPIRCPLIKPDKTEEKKKSIKINQ